MKHINPTLKIKKRTFLSAHDYSEAIRKGNRAALSEAITLIESHSEKHKTIAEEIINNCLPYSGTSIRIGITGVPGVGKSTFIEYFGDFLIQKSNKIAVLAIDPSSQKSGGSILGDKTRMEQLSQNENAFIRPSPNAGSLGGVAKMTRESIILCEAAGFNVILVETVGVGQSETAVYNMVDFFLLLLLAGAGDDLQGMKRGIMEMADGYLINKADGDNLKASQKAKSDIQHAIQFLFSKSSNWIPKVQLSSSYEKQSFSKIWEIIECFEAQEKENGNFESRRKKQQIAWMEKSIEHELYYRFYSNEIIQTEFKKLRQEVAEGKQSPFLAAEILIQLSEKQNLRRDKS